MSFTKRKRTKVAQYWIPTTSYLLDVSGVVNFPNLHTQTNQAVIPLAGAASSTLTDDDPLEGLTDKEFVVTRVVGRVYIAAVKGGDVIVSGATLQRLQLAVGIVDTDDTGAPSDALMNTSAYDVKHVGRNAFFHRQTAVVASTPLLDLFTSTGLNVLPFCGEIGVVGANVGWSTPATQFGKIDVKPKRVVRADQKLVLSISTTTCIGDYAIPSNLAWSYAHDLRVLGHMRVRARK